MKNRSISEQISLLVKKEIGLYADVQIGKDRSRNADLNISSSTDLGLTSVLKIFSPKIHGRGRRGLEKSRRDKEEETE